MHSKLAVYRASNPILTLYRVKNPMRFSNNLHDFSIVEYRKVKINENNCKNNLTFSVFSRISFVSPRVTPTTLTETQYENNSNQRLRKQTPNHDFHKFNDWSWHHPLFCKLRMGSNERRQ